MRRRSALTLLVPASLALTVAIGASPASADLVSDPLVVDAEGSALALEPIGTFESGIFEGGGAEIVAYHAASARLLVVNAQAATVQVLDASDPTDLTAELLFELPPEAAGGVANSVAVRADGLTAVAVEAPEKTDPGFVVFFDAAGDGTPLGSVEVGALPDMVTFSPDGSRVLTANEGEPNDEYTIDPQGSVSVITVAATVTAPAQAAVATVGFTEYDTGARTLPADVRVYAGIAGSATPIADSLEPEYITVSDDGTRAWVTLQEANALAVIDVPSASLVDVVPLGFKDWSASAFDASDDDGAVNLQPWPVLGIYSPDSIGHYTAGGAEYLVTANEGDARDYETYEEEERAADLTLCPSVDPALAAAAADDTQLGRLNISIANGFDEAGDCYAELYTLGGRSFSIWSASGELVFDSGSELEELTAAAGGDLFNSDNSENGSFDSRSDSKGPEPEGLALGAVEGRTFAFIGLERPGGIVAYDVTDPQSPAFQTYVNNRDLTVADPLDPAIGDLGPEGLAFIAAADSPTGTPLLAVGNEISGTTTLYSVLVDAAVIPAGPGAPAPVPTLPATGSDAAVAGIAALTAGLFAAAGAVLLVIRRRRSA